MATTLQEALRNAFPNLKETQSITKEVPLRKAGKVMSRRQAERQALRTAATDAELQASEETITQMGEDETATTQS